MQVLVLGGTGSVGSAVLRALSIAGHHVTALTRSEAAARKAQGLGAKAVVQGDISVPGNWIATLPKLDAVIHMACDFSDSMAETDARLLDHLLPHLASVASRVKMLYTGGCWLFGDTGSRAGNESSKFAPLPAFAWMVAQARRVLEAPDIDGVVIHPGMVYGTDDFGVFRHFARQAQTNQPVCVIGSEQVCWPLVHRDDLAQFYVLAMEHSLPRQSYLGVAIEGLAVGRIARAFARRYRGIDLQPEVITEDAIAAEMGEWARGYGMNQRLSGDKARETLGWTPIHLDPESEIARLP